MILIAAAPILPLLLVFGVGAGMFALAASAKGSGGKALNKPVVKNGVEYGAQCSYVKVLDPAKAFSKSLEEKIIATAKSLDENDLAFSAMVKMMKLAFPGPGCDWGDSEFDTTLFAANGLQYSWAEVRETLGEKTLLEATNDGTFAKYIGTGGLQHGLLESQRTVVMSILKFIKPPLAPSPYNPPAPLKWSQDRQYYSVFDHFMKQMYYIVLIKAGGGYRWEMFSDPETKKPLMHAGQEWSSYGNARLKPLDTLLDAMSMIQMGGPVTG